MSFYVVNNVLISCQLNINHYICDYVNQLKLITMHLFYFPGHPV